MRHQQTIPVKITKKVTFNTSSSTLETRLPSASFDVPEFQAIISGDSLSGELAKIAPSLSEDLKQYTVTNVSKGKYGMKELEIRLERDVNQSQTVRDLKLEVRDLKLEVNMLQVQVKQLDTELQTLKSKMAKTTDAFDDWQLYNNLVKACEVVGWSLLSDQQREACTTLDIHDFNDLYHTSTQSTLARDFIFSLNPSFIYLYVGVCALKTRAGTIRNPLPHPPISVSQVTVLLDELAPGLPDDVRQGLFKAQVTVGKGERRVPLFIEDSS